MKHLFTKLAFTASAIALLSGIIFIRAMTTTDTQTIIEDIATAPDQIMDLEEDKSAMDSPMTSEMQEIAEPEMAETQTDEEFIGEEPAMETMETSAIETEEPQPTITAEEEQSVADEEGTPSMEGLPEQEQAEQEAQEVNLFMGDESPVEGLAP